MIMDKRAFAPFLLGRHSHISQRATLLNFFLGPFSCVGKQLALMELRMVISSTIWNYDFEFAPSEDGSTIENDTLDLVILKAGKLDLVFKKRDV
jgi:cytochrome P450 family 628